MKVTQALGCFLQIFLLSLGLATCAYAKDILEGADPAIILNEFHIHPFYIVVGAVLFLLYIFWRQGKL